MHSIRSECKRWIKYSATFSNFYIYFQKEKIKSNAIKINKHEKNGNHHTGSDDPAGLQN